MNPRVGVVVNPISDPERAEELVEKLRMVSELRIIETTEDDPGRAMAAELVEDGFPIIVAAGGDGTVRACAEALAGTDVTLAVLPLGTGNLLAANLDLPEDINDIVGMILDGNDVRIDVGEVNDESFLVMTGFGLDTTIMDSTDRETKDRLGPLAYVLTALSHLDDFTVPAKITIDGAAPIDTDVATCLIGNMGEVLGSLDVFPEAEWDDGRLDVIAIEARGVRAWASAARETLGDDVETEHVSRWTAERVLIEFESPQPYEMDGESRPETDRLEITVRRRALKVRRANT